MKRFVVLWSLFLAGIVGIGVLNASYSNTPQRQLHGYVHVRPGGVVTDDTALTVSTSAWSDVEDWVEIPEEWDTVSLSFYAYGDGSGDGDSHGAVFDANVYVAHAYGSALRVCRLHGEVGNLEMSHDPAYGPGSQYRTDRAADSNHKWAQGPMTLNESFWRSPIGLSGCEDGIGEVNFNHNGATHIYVAFDNVADASRWFCVMTGRKR